MPVATPTANVTAKMRVQKAALRSHTSLPVRALISSVVATSQASPIVMDGKTKWNATVSANWARASRAASMDGSSGWVPSRCPERTRPR